MGRNHMVKLFGLVMCLSCMVADESVISESNTITGKLEKVCNGTIGVREGAART